MLFAKRILLSVFFLTLGLHVFAQARCGTAELFSRLKQQDPTLATRRAEQESQLRLSMQMQPLAKTNQILTIPIVFHILWDDSTQNIPDSDVVDQLAVLNAHFRRAFADTNATPDAFKPVAADCEIEFCLATVDENGLPTSGITRKHVPTALYADSTFPDVVDSVLKDAALGGVDAWDATRYYNIWVCNIQGKGLAGYAYYPNTIRMEYDGVVMDFGYFGPRPVTGGSSDGRVLIHETGHYLNLIHVWGDDSCGTDEVDDTPTAQQPNWGCPLYPNYSCSLPDTSFSDMFSNYMDYTDGYCQNILTFGQKARMRAVMQISPRASLLSSNGCSQTTGTPNLLAALPFKVYPNPTTGLICLQGELDNAANARLTVYNTVGSVVFVQDFVNAKSLENQVNIGGLAAGTYQVEVRAGKAAYHQRIVKQ